MFISSLVGAQKTKDNVLDVVGAVCIALDHAALMQSCVIHECNIEMAIGSRRSEEKGIALG